MALLSQALHLGYLLSPHSAFQGHAAHTARWPAMLSPNGSAATCIADGVFHIPMPFFHGALPVYSKVLRHSYSALSRRTVNQRWNARLPTPLRAWRSPKVTSSLGQRCASGCLGRSASWSST